MFQVYYASDNDWWNFIAHMGRKGQKWYHRNGPPYPLDISKVPQYNKTGIIKAEALEKYMM